MADVPIKLNSKLLRVSTRGDEYNETYIVTGLTSAKGWDPWDALKAPGIPSRYTNPLEDRPDLYVKDYDVVPIDDSTGGDYHVTVIYRPLGGTITWPPPDIQAERWSIGTMTQHVDVDLDGNPIGQHSFEVWREYDASKIPLEDRDAQFGVDILTPTVELEIQMPPGSFQNYLPPAELAQLAGTVNTGNFIVGARPHAKPAIIPEGYCLYHGCQLDPVLIEANKFAWIHRFSIGSMLLPGGISAMMHDGTPWTKPDLPIRYAYWTAYGAKNKAGDFIDVDGDGNLIGLEEGDDYMQRVPKALVIAPVYAYGGNFNARLGII